MAGFRIIKSDFPDGATGQSLFGQVSIVYREAGRSVLFPLTQYNVQDVQIITEENQKRLLGTVGWGFAGGLLLGPVGLLAGVLAGGRHKEICFIVHFTDGTKMLAAANNRIFQQILALTFQTGSEDETPQEPLDPTAEAAADALLNYFGLGDEE